MTKVRSGHVAFSIGGRGYISTGISGSVQTGGKYLVDLWKYNPETDTWAQKADFPGVGRRSASAFVLNDEAYVGLGVQSNTVTSMGYSDMWKYNPTSNSWI
nr:kelch repeat-containing protein [Fulvivirga marina]